MKRFLPALAGLLALAAWSLGQEPTGVNATKEYFITPEVGPYTICAASFIGETSGKLAHDLVRELRTRYALPAYLYNRGDEQRREQRAELDRKRQQQRDYLERMGLHPDVPLPLRTVRIEDQYAVLVGGFRDMEAARKELDRIKSLDEPKSVPLEKVYKWLLPKEGDKNQEGTREETRVSPFKKSFVVPNPTVPLVKEPDNKPDPFLKELNSGESYSLLNCRKHWTMVVKVFQGPVVVQHGSTSSSFLDKLGFGDRGADALDATAKQAHEVARVLRESPGLKYEAYVWHTRYGSLVTVGGYDTLEDLKFKQDQRTLASLKLGTVVQLNTQPMPMEVPRY